MHLKSNSRQIRFSSWPPVYLGVEQFFPKRGKINLAKAYRKFAKKLRRDAEAAEKEAIRLESLPSIKLSEQQEENESDSNN